MGGLLKPTPQGAGVWQEAPESTATADPHRTIHQGQSPGSRALGGMTQGSLVNTKAFALGPPGHMVHDLHGPAQVSIPQGNHTGTQGLSAQSATLPRRARVPTPSL